MTLPIIIDTDPGQDDAVAIMLALASPEIEVLGLTTVAGNVPVHLTSMNALKVCELAGRREIPVFAGAARPLVRSPVTAEEVHGRTGLDGSILPVPKMPLQTTYAVDFIVDTLMARPAGTVTVCTLGPLTNLGLALLHEPRIATRIRQIVTMGGGYFEQGNITPSAEFNIYVDPHAARLVLESGAPITLIPLDCTHQLLTTKARVSQFKKMQNLAGPAIADMLEFFERYDEAKYGPEGAPLHDPSVIAWLLEPTLFEGKLVNVSIECESQLTMGATVIDWWRVTGRPHNAMVIGSANAEGFFKLLSTRIARLP